MSLVSTRKGRGVSLLYRGEADSSLYTIEIVSLLYVKEAGLFSVQRRECLSSQIEEADSFYVQ